ncbi:MAG: hypothetical protein HFI01_01955 [Lachnospiraceae bacterium]|nr:hypothetical protein [Lachnospiraceae bacterium]MCI9341745.1 hypothetical protein [Lachnospiraceae bacterium]
MARGVRKTIEEKIADKQEVIDALETRIQKEREELQDLINEQRMARLESLEELIDNSNLSLEEVMEILRRHVDA